MRNLSKSMKSVMPRRRQSKFMMTQRASRPFRRQIHDQVFVSDGGLAGLETWARLHRPHRQVPLFFHSTIPMETTTLFPLHRPRTEWPRVQAGALRDRSVCSAPEQAIPTSRPESTAAVSAKEASVAPIFGHRHWRATTMTTARRVSATAKLKMPKTDMIDGAREPVGGPRGLSGSWD